MPGFDRTGPRGQGPLTGGGRGFCGSGRYAGYGVGRGGRPWGGGRGRCWGGGWGQGWHGAAPPLLADEREALQAEAAEMEARLRAIEERLAQLEPKAD